MESTSAPLNIAIVWAQYGPYHFARMSALKKLASAQVRGIQVAHQTSFYAWNRPQGAAELMTLCPGSVFETVSFSKVFSRARSAFKELSLDVCILPGYAPKQVLATLLAAKS